MPIYFGFPSSDKNNKHVKVSTKLLTKGIELLRAPPSKIRTICLPFADSPLWNVYVNNLSPIILSLSSGAPTPMSLESYDDIAKHPNPLPAQYPDLCIGINNTNQETTRWLQEQGFEEQQIRNETTWLLHNPASRDLARLTRNDCPLTIKKKVFAPVGYVNLNAATELAFILSLMSWSAQCLAIPMFDKDIDRKVLTTNLTPPAAGEEGGITTTSPDAAKFAADRLLLLSHKDIVKIFDDTTTGSLNEYDDSVDAAILAPYKAHYSVSDLLNDTKLPGGVLLRYVEELCDSDPEGVPSFIENHVLRSLGGDLEEILEKVDDIRSAWGVIRTTRTGHVLSHIAKAMEIAIKCSAGVRLIFERGFYEGTLIVGCGFSITINSDVYLSKSVMDLRIELSSMETHSRALADIKAILFSGEMEVDNRSEIKSMAELRNVCLLSQIVDQDKGRVMELARKLRFGRNKLSVNVGNILWLLNHVLDGSDTFGDDDPIAPTALFTTDKLEVAMSCFPELSCPSFRHPSGVAVKLTSDKAPTPPKDNVHKKATGANAGQVNNGGWIFTVRRVEYKEALVDFASMMTSKEARSTSSSVARQMGYFVLSGGNFELVFQKLKQCTTRFGAQTATNPEVLNATSHGEKRELNASDAGEKPKKRRNYF